MSKVKVHELAKEFGISSNELIKKANDLGINVTSHMNVINDDQVEVLKKHILDTQNNKEEGKKNKMQKKPKNEVKKEVKKEEKPVIIRREVIISEDVEEKKEEKNNKSNKLNFEEARKKDYNIVYRERPQKPMTVDELFGLKKDNKKETKKEVKIENKEELQNNKKDDIVKENNVKVEEKKEPAVRESINANMVNEVPSNSKVDIKKENNHVQNKNVSENDGNSQKTFNKKGNGDIRNNRNRFNDRNDRRNNDHKFNNQNNKFGDKKNNNFRDTNNRNNKYSDNRENKFNNRNNNFKKKVLDNYGIEKNIKNIMAVDTVEKESVREYQNKAIDKQKMNKKYEEGKNKKNTKSKRDFNNEFDDVKLKDLKQSNKLSHMFTEGDMLDYYDLSNNRNRKNKKKANKEQKPESKQKIFKLTEITIPENISVKNLAAELKKTTSEVIKKLFDYGIMATINNELDFDTAYLVAQEFGVNAIKKEEVKEEDILFDETED